MKIVLVLLALTVATTVNAADAYATRYKAAVAKVPARTLKLEAVVTEAIKKVREGRANTSLAAAAATGSMKPTFDENYLVVLEECKFGAIRPRDVILTSLGDSAAYAGVMHRVTETVGLGAYRTKGDALKNPDPVLTTSKEYLGRRVVAAIHLETGKIVYMNPITPPHET